MLIPLYHTIMIHSALKQHFGFDAFLNGQEDVISRITEVCGMEENIITSQDIFMLSPQENLQPTGMIPAFFQIFSSCRFIWKKYPISSR